MNTVMLNHFPAYKWAPFKNSILRRAFYRAVNSFIKMWWIDCKITLDSQNLLEPFTLNSNVGVLYFKFGNGGLHGGVIGLPDILNIAVVCFN